MLIARSKAGILHMLDEVKDNHDENDQKTEVIRYKWHLFDKHLGCPCHAYLVQKLFVGS
jgi:hypothetical protein